MRSIKYLIITLLLTICLIPNIVNAAGNISVSPGSITITRGSTAALSITANNAAGRIDVSTSNPNVASISESSKFLDMQTWTITVTGKAAGSAIITITNTDVTTYDDEDLSGRTQTVHVVVTEPQQIQHHNLKVQLLIIR